MRASLGACAYTSVEALRSAQAREQKEQNRKKNRGLSWRLLQPP